MKHELPDVQAGLKKGRGTRYQIANIGWIIEKAREFQKNNNNNKNLFLLYWLSQSLWLCSVQLSRSVVSNSLQRHEPQHARSPCPSPTPSPLKPVSTESMMPSNHPILCCLLFLLPPIPPSIRVFSNESALRIRWLKYWSFSFNISPSKEHPGLISFKMDWLDLLAVQGTLKSLLQHHCSKALILQRSAFFIVQISHPYMTPGKTITLTRQTFVGKIISAF